MLKGDLATEVSALERRVDGEILVYASYQLGQALLKHDLVDEVRLTVFPVVLGAGKRLFDQSTEQRPLRLVHTQTLGEGLVFFSYARDRAA